MVGKVRSKGLDLASFRVQKAFFEANFNRSSSDEVIVPRPVGVIPRWRMWLQGWEAGTPLESMILSPDRRDAIAHVRRVGRAALRLHDAGVRAQRCHAVGDEIRILSSWLERAGRARPELKGKLDRIFATALRVARELDGAPTTGVHRDLHPGQFLVASDRLVILDFDLYAEGDPALDHGNFLAHLTELSVRHFGDPGELDQVEGAYREEISLGREGLEPPRIDGWHALSLARHVGLSTARPGRSDTTEALVELSIARLEAASAPVTRNALPAPDPATAAAKPDPRAPAGLGCSTGAKQSGTGLRGGVALLALLLLPVAEVHAQVRHTFTPGLDVTTLYDSNVNRRALESRGLAGVVTTGIARYRRRAETDFRAEYEIGIHRYNEDTPWNRVSHKARMDARRRVGSRGTAGVVAEFQVRGSGEDRSLGDQLSVEPSIRASLAPWAQIRSRLISRKRWNRESVGGVSTVRAESAALAAVDLRLEVGDRTDLEFEIRHERNRSDTGRRDFRGPRLELAFSRQLTERDALSVELEWRTRSYRSRTVRVGEEEVLRKDTRLTPHIALERSFSRHLVTRLAYQFEARRSNDPARRVNAHELSLSARVLF